MDELVEFLRARLAEQEEPLREIVRQLDAHAASDDETGIDGGWTLWGSFGRAVDAAFKPRQMLKAVEAKRQLVDEVLAWEHKRLYNELDGNLGPYRLYPCSREGDECDPDDCGTRARQLAVLSRLAKGYGYQGIDTPPATEVDNGT